MNLRLTQLPELRAVPKVRPIRWWLFRLSLLPIVLFTAAAAEVPGLCLITNFFDPGGPLISFNPRVQPPQYVCTTSWNAALRLELVGTGLVLALLLIGLGSLLDRRTPKGTILTDA